MSASPLYRVDKFIVPPQSLDRFLERVKKTHDALDQADGCERNLILEQFDWTGAVQRRHLRTVA